MLRVERAFKELSVNLIFPCKIFFLPFSNVKKLSILWHLFLINFFFYLFFSFGS